jgi:hypothetical protein
MAALTDFLDDPKGGRYPCEICGSSDGLSIDEESGQTGFVHCFSCDWPRRAGVLPDGRAKPGTGAQYLHDARGLPLHEAIELLGGPPARSDAPGRDVKQVKRQVQKRRRKQAAQRPLYGDFPNGKGLTLLEVNRLLASLTPREKQLWNYMLSLPGGLPPALCDDADAGRLISYGERHRTKKQLAATLLRVFWDNLRKQETRSPSNSLPSETATDQ